MEQVDEPTTEDCDYCKMTHKYWYEHCGTCKHKPKDEPQTADVCTWDGKVGEIEIHNILYEPTYNEDDGSM